MLLQSVCPSQALSMVHSQEHLGHRSLMRSDNELCFIYTPVAQCCYVTIYRLLQTDSVNTAAAM